MSYGELSILYIKTLVNQYVDGTSGTACLSYCLSKVGVVCSRPIIIGHAGDSPVFRLLGKELDVGEMANLEGNHVLFGRNLCEFFDIGFYVANSNNVPGVQAVNTCAGGQGDGDSDIAVNFAIGQEVSIACCDAYCVSGSDVGISGFSLLNGYFHIGLGLADLVQSRAVERHSARISLHSERAGIAERLGGGFGNVQRGRVIVATGGRHIDGYAVAFNVAVTGAAFYSAACAKITLESGRIAVARNNKLAVKLFDGESAVTVVCALIVSGDVSRDVTGERAAGDGDNSFVILSYSDSSANTSKAAA